MTGSSCGLRTGTNGRFAAILLFFGIVAMAGGASAETVRLTVPAGKASPLGGFYIYFRHNCYTGPRASYTISRGAAHGTVSVVESRRAIRVLKRCPSQKANVLDIIYRPRPGFRGEDRFSITFTYNRYDGHNMQARTRQDYIVTVK